MKRNNLCGLIALLAGLMILVSGTSWAMAAGNMAPVLRVDGEVPTPAVALRWEQGTMMAPLEELGAHLEVNCQQNEADGTLWVQKYGHTILFNLATGEVRKNSQPISTPVPAQSVNETIYVPLRLVAENLGFTVAWDAGASEVQIITGERRMPPERVSSETFNALVAYTDQGNLWFLDGRYPNTQPRQITDSGYAQLIGWSPDGAWLAYAYSHQSENDLMYLWVVRSDGSGARQVDFEPIYDAPQWAPNANKLVYGVISHVSGDHPPTNIIKCADLTTGEIQIKSLMEESAVGIPSWAWHPDGERVTVSIPRTGEQPPTLKQVNLGGGQEVLYTLKDENPVDDELYTWAYISLKWSPDGRYLAYHLRTNAGSLTADVVETGVLEAAAGQTVSLNEGLKYPQWLAFSPDSKQLAYIAGVGRDAMLEKNLEIAGFDNNGQVINHSETGYVDAQPVWLPGPPGDAAELLFCRGLEDQDLSYMQKLPGVIVPNQRIYQLDRDGKARAITTGPTTTADYYPNPSPSGREMLFLRLTRFNQGSLYLQPLHEPGQAVEILRGLRGNAGYYGNYYPEWISIRWF